MTAEILSIHSKNPELSKISKVVNGLKDGKVVVYPTDTGFALGCQLSNKDAISRIRQVRQLPSNKSLTFLCESLSNVSEFAKVSNTAYRTIKGLIPGPYTFILPASKEVPKYAQDPKKNTTGIRVPENLLCQTLLTELGSPLISISAKLDDEGFHTPDEVIEQYSKLVDYVITSDSYDFVGESTVIDMTTDEFSIIREGAGMELARNFID